MSPPEHPSILTYKDAHPFSQVPLTDRASLQDLLKTLLNPLLPHFSPQSSRIRIPGSTAVRFDITASDIEGFARPLWGLAPLLAGGGEYEAAERWIEGLKAGTDPENEEFWGLSVDSDQRMVEMCCIGYALAIVPAIWDKFNEEEKANVGRYLGGINDKVMPNTNWLWFRVFANLGLLANSSPSGSLEKIKADVKHLESFYRGDGWSNDGPPHIHQMDYYSGSFAIQVLQLLYASLASKDDSENAAEFKSRATLFIQDFVHYFDEEGRAVPFGRSTGYRFAMTAFWSACAVADVELPSGISWGVVKGIVFRNFRWWQSQPEIFSSAGTLNLGYSYPNMYMCENYNSPGSPYWSFISFLALSVPETHPFWSSPELPYPTSTLSKVHAISHPKHIISYHGSHRMLLSSGQACGYPMKGTHAKYGKFAYSSAYTFSVPTGCFTLEQFVLDSTLGFSDDGGEVWKTRRVCEEAGIVDKDGEPVLRSVWKAFDDVRVETWLLSPREETACWHVRAHKIVCGRDVLTAEGAFAISNVRKEDKRALREYDPVTKEGTSPRIFGNYDLNTQGTRTPRQEGTFAVSKGAVGIVDLITGIKSDEEYAMIVNADPNSNLVESKTVIPTLMGSMKKGETRWAVVGVYAKPGGEPKDYLDGWDKKPNIPKWLEAALH